LVHPGSQFKNDVSGITPDLNRSVFGATPYDQGTTMCFSAAANFVGSGVLGGLGVATMLHVKHRRELMFASLPLLFALHQFTEGFVWLAADGILSTVIEHDAGAAFMLFAQGLLPALIPLSVMLFERTAKRRRVMLPFVILGFGLTLYTLWGLAAFPTQVFAQHHSIVYLNQATNYTAIAVLYVIATCGSLFASENRDMILFGIANVVILLIVMAVKRYAFTSVWCAYAAAASITILAYFWKSRKVRPFEYVGQV
jgi:hypothetical protein